MPKLTNNYAKSTDAIKAGETKARIRAAQSHVAISQQLAPVSDNNEPGHVHMKDRIKIAGSTFDVSVGQFRETGTGRFSAPVNLDVVSEAEYSSHVEFGTTMSEAQPFFIPGFESAQRQYRDEVGQAVNDELRAIKV